MFLFCTEMPYFWYTNKEVFHMEWPNKSTIQSKLVLGDNSWSSIRLVTDSGKGKWSNLALGLLKIFLRALSIYLTKV